ncbi:MAG: hypothetical protein PHG21_08755 [Azoarcus sp.]|nr:hypothetical protein [Azoarcus sp.]
MHSGLSSFMRKALHALLLVGMVSLAGCAAFEPPRPFTTEAEALAARGEPSRRWQNDDTTTTLEYATQPNGETCLMIQVDPGGIVLRQWDALSDENLARVRKGMSPDEVSRLLGQHRSEQTFPLSGETVWDWNIRNYGPGVATLFNVHFMDGKVLRTSQSYVFPPEYGMFPPWGMRPFGFPYADPFYPAFPPPRRRPPVPPLPHLKR